MVDVYATTSRRGGEIDFDQDFVSTLLTQVGDQLWWIGHRFDGEFGVVNESSWKRRGNEVYFVVDAANPSYQWHSACDWIWNSDDPIYFEDGSCIVWAAKATLGGMYAVHFKRVDPFGSDMPQFTMKTPERLSTYRVTHALPRDWVLWCGLGSISDFWFTDKEWFTRSTVATWFFQSATLCVPVEVWQNLVDNVDLLRYEELTWSQTLHSTKMEVQKNKVIMQLRRSFPMDKEFEHYVLKLAEMVYCDNLPLKTKIMRRVASNWFHFLSFNELRQIGKTFVRWWKIPLWAVPIFVMVLALACQKVRPLPMQTPAHGNIFSHYSKPLFLGVGYVLQQSQKFAPHWVKRYASTCQVAVLNICDWFVSAAASLWTGAQTVVESLKTALTPAAEMLKAATPVIKQYTPSMTTAYSLYSVPASVVWAIQSWPNAMNTMLPLLPQIAGGVIFEEIFKSMAGTPIFNFLEFGSKLLSSLYMGSFFTVAPLALMPAMMHDSISDMGIVCRILFHVLYNMWPPAAALLLPFLYLRRGQKEMALFSATWVVCWMPLLRSYLEVALRETADRLALEFGAPHGSLPLVLLFFMGLISLLKLRKNKYADYITFRENFYIKDWPDRAPWIINPGCTAFPVEFSRTPQQAVSYYTAKKTCGLIQFSYECPVPSKQPQQAFYYWFLPTNVPGYVPMRSDENLLAVYLARILVEAPLDPEIQLEFWKKHMSRYVTFIAQMAPIPWADLVDEWINHFDDRRKRRRYEHAKQQFMANPNVLQKALLETHIMVKTDEMLLKFETDRTPRMKPRSIANVDEIPQLVVGPEIYEAQTRLKLLWSPTCPFVVKIDGVVFSLAYGGAATDLEMTQWMYWVLTDSSCHVHIIVSGDDSLVYDTRTCLWAEGDAAMFDQSQSFGPLAFERAVLSRLGVSNRALRVLKKLTTATYTSYPRSGRGFFKANRELRAMRDTGGTDTSLGNSINMAFAWVHVSLSDKEHKETFAQLGFDMKIRYHATLERATFLKGMWYRVKGGPYSHYWGPLPSRFLKMGKSLKDPFTLQHYKRAIQEEPTSEVPFVRAAKMFLSDVAHSYGAFLPVPLVRTFADNFRRGPMIRNVLEEHQIKASKDLKPQFDGLEQISLHYEVPTSWWAEVEALIPSEPFHFLQHPLLEALLKDYN
jgi:hypothetical protein